MRYLWLVVAGLLVGWGMGCSRYEDRGMGLMSISARLQANQEHLRAIAGQLREYHKTTGTYPTNEQSLHPVEKPLHDYYVAQNPGWRPLLRVLPSGLTGLWGEPFIYENRRDLPASAFAGSGATVDTNRAYSIRVDRGVYVWSVGGQQKYLEYRRKLVLLNWVDVAWRGSWLIALFCIVMFARSCQRTVRDGNAGLALLQIVLGAIIAIASWAFGITPFLSTCYRWGIGAANRDPALEQRYKAVMQKYSEQGVISKEALQKLNNALEEDKKTEDYLRLE